MTNHQRFSKPSRSPGFSTERRPHASEAGQNLLAVEWQAAGKDLCSAQAQLGVGGLVYLSVESLGTDGWDWLVWDANCQALPRHGLAATESAAKWQAELSVQEVDAMLLDILGPAEQGAGNRQ